MSRPSLLRREINAAHDAYFAMLPPVEYVLDVGIGGDPWPGANYERFKHVAYETIDVDACWHPTHVGDICASGLADSTYDLIILSQTLEHVWDTRLALRECLRLLLPGGHLVVDVPWIYPYHAEPGFDDYWRISATAMARLLTETGFTVIAYKQGDHGTYALARR